jgi:hypothetical protein
MDTSQNLPSLQDTITTYNVFIKNVNDDNEVFLLSRRIEYKNRSDSVSALLVFNGVVLSGDINLKTFIMKFTETNKGSVPLKIVIEMFIDEQIRNPGLPRATLIMFKNGSLPQQDIYNLREVEEAPAAEKIKSIQQPMFDSDSVFELNINGGSVDDIVELLEHIKTKYVAEKKKVNSYEFDTIFMSNVRTTTAVSAQDGNAIIKINTSNYLEKIASTIAKPLVPRNIVNTVTSAIQTALGEETLRDPMYIQFRNNKYKKLGSLEKTGILLENASKKIDIDPILLRLYDADMSVVFQGNVKVIRKKGTEFVVENPDALLVANNKTFNNCHVQVTIARAP